MSDARFNGSHELSFYPGSSSTIEGSDFVPGQDYTLHVCYPENTKFVNVTFDTFDIGNRFPFLDSAQAGATTNFNR